MTTVRWDFDMVERIPQKLYAAMVNEISAWRDDALIDGALADTLIARYHLAAPRNNAVTLLTVIGAVLVGLGTLLYIGSNWQSMATCWKLFLLIAAIIATHAAGWSFKFQPGNRPRLGTAFLLLGSLFFGAGIWLVAQMFNLDINYPNGLLLWAIGTAASAVVTRSVAVGVLASLLVAAWTLSPIDLWFAHSKDIVEGVRAVFGTLAGLSLAWSLRSRAMTWITLVTTTFWILADSSTFAPGQILWGFALFGAYLWMRANLQIGAQPFKYVGICSTLPAILYLTCNRNGLFEHQSTEMLFGLLSGAVAMQLVVLIKLKSYRNEAIASLLLIGYFFLFATNPIEFCRVIAFNFMALGTIFGLAWAGTRHLQSPGMVNIAIVFAVIYIICRYFDMFFSMMDRSLFFVLGGVVLMTIGAAAERGRRHLIGSMA